jgi:hypothetical protein
MNSVIGAVKTHPHLSPFQVSAFVLAVSAALTVSADGCGRRTGQAPHPD